MDVNRNRMVEDPTKPAKPSLPARPVLGGATAGTVKRPPDAELQPVRPPAAETQGTVNIPASALTPNYTQTQGGTYDPRNFVTPAQETQEQAPVNLVEQNTEPPPLQPGEKAYTWKELEDFQAAMSAADKAAMQERQQTMYRRGKYTNTPSATTIRLAQPYDGNWYYDYGEEQWLDHWGQPSGGNGAGGQGGTPSAGAGAGVGTGAGTSAGGNVGTGAGGSFGSADNLTSLLEEWKKAAAEQANGQIDYAVTQAVAELERALEDSKALYREQAESVTRDEMQGLDNSALYAEMRGDKGGIGQAQYNEIQAAAAQNRLVVQQAQTKLATDTSRQIADLRAQGEFEKADKLLEITQTYLSQLISLEQWQAEFGLSREQFMASLDQWQKEYDLAVDQFKYGKSSDSRDLVWAMANAGMNLSDDQLQQLGMSREDYNAWIAQKQMEAAYTTMDLTTAREAAKKGAFTDEVLEVLRKNGYTDEMLEKIYGYKPKGPESPAKSGLTFDDLGENAKKLYEDYVGSGLWSPAAMGGLVEEAYNNGLITEEEADFLLKLVGM